MIRWPWVRRARHEREIAVWERSSHGWSAQCAGLLDLLHQKERREDRESARYDSLLAKYHELRLQGAAAPTPPVTLPPDTMDPLEREVRRQFAGQPVLLTNALRQLAIDRGAGIAADEILEQLRSGVTLDEIGIPA